MPSHTRPIILILQAGDEDSTIPIALGEKPIAIVVLSDNDEGMLYVTVGVIDETDVPKGRLCKSSQYGRVPLIVFEIDCGEVSRYGKVVTRVPGIGRRYCERNYPSIVRYDSRVV